MEVPHAENGAPASADLHRSGAAAPLRADSWAGVICVAINPIRVVLTRGHCMQQHAPHCNCYISVASLRWCASDERGVISQRGVCGRVRDAPPMADSAQAASLSPQKHAASPGTSAAHHAAHAALARMPWPTGQFPAGVLLSLHQPQHHTQPDHTHASQKLPCSRAAGPHLVCVHTCTPS
jgi:hypothetical protein